jgi:hypothetical protein
LVAQRRFLPLKKVVVVRSAQQQNRPAFVLPEKAIALERTDAVILRGDQAEGMGKAKGERRAERSTRGIEENERLVAATDPGAVSWLSLIKSD